MNEASRLPEGREALVDRYREVVEQIPAVTYVIPPGKPDLPCTHVSPQIEQLLGYTPEEWMASADLWQRVLHPDDRDRVLEISDLADRREAEWNIQYRALHRDGHEVWIHDRAEILEEPETGTSRWHGVLFDITPQKKIEQALAESEARYRALVEQVPAVAYLVTNDETPATVHISESVERITGYTQKEMQSDVTLWIGRIHEEDRSGALLRWNKAVAADAPLEHEYRFLRKDGSMLWVKDRSVPIHDQDGRPSFRQGITFDVTERKHREEQLRESEATYRALVENIPAVVYILAPDGDGSTLYVSPHVERILGYSREEWLEQPDIWMELLHPDDRESVLATYDRSNETGEGWSGEYRLIASDGRIVWFRDDATLVRDDDGQPRFWQGVRLDITAQKRAQEALRRAHDELDHRVRERTAMLEEANEMMMLEIAERKATEARLRRAEEKYRGLVEQIPGAVPYVWEIDPTGEYADVYTSPAIESLVGYSPEEWFRGELWLHRTHPDDLERAVEAARRSERDGIPYDVEVRYLHKDGRIVWVHDKAVLLERAHDGKPRLFNGVMIDITSRKQAEARTRIAEDGNRSILERIPGAVAYVWDAHAQGDDIPIAYVSPQIAQVLGFTVNEWRSPAPFWLDRVHPDDRDRIRARTDRCAETGEPFADEYRFLGKDGRLVWVMDQAVMLERTPDGRPWLFQGVFFDITERKQFERQIEDAEQRYRTLIEQIPAIVYVEAVDRGNPEASRIVFVSPQVEEVLGYTAEELLAEPNHLQRLIHPDDWPGFETEDRRSSRTGTPFSHEYRAIAKDGSIVWLHSKAVLVRDEEGRPRFWHGLALDVSARHRSPEASTASTPAQAASSDPQN